MRLLLSTAALAASLLLSGCYMNVVTPTPNLTVRLEANSPARSGTATCTEVLWNFAFGDCSINAALRNGSLSRVHHVDSKTKVIFYGLYSELTITAYGE